MPEKELKKSKNKVPEVEKNLFFFPGPCWQADVPKAQAGLGAQGPGFSVGHYPNCDENPWSVLRAEETL